jgi:hypothetical protein
MDNGPPDKRGLKILTGHYWSSQGWVPENERTVTPEDFDYAKSKGLMFDPIAIGHDDVMGRLLSALSEAGRRLTADAFVASLSFLLATKTKQRLWSAEVIGPVHGLQARR